MASIPTNHKDSLGDRIALMNQRIAARAYELSRSRNGQGDSFGDWLSAERELVEKPPVELRERDDVFTVVAALPGINAKDISVDITTREVLIQAVSHHRHTEERGQVLRSEFTVGEVFRSLPFPRPVDAKNAKAVYQNGMLNITVPVAQDVPIEQRDSSPA